MFNYKAKQNEKKQQSKDRLIEKLLKQVEELQSKVTDLEKELEFEKNKPNGGYEEAKKLISELEQKKQEYQSLMEEVYKIRDSYNQKIAETLEVKAKYSAELDKLLSEVRDGIKTKKNKFTLKNKD